ncbi:hypothetical protein SLNSH_20610 [Alsobacter soli]|uniref:Lipopolysaccharide biosynthesis protein n=1 Tax=Alsobacter soli TaxID=2109933 RepID=A0A2T1HN98_9HYPH|nr:hypothetical protein [Alsobacter soli]PSC03134.1 hypothetical protein SLNSH_20610 [Alsobacter soli]
MTSIRRILPAGAGWNTLGVLALSLPIALAAALSYLPAKRFEASTLILLDGSRGSVALVGSEDRRGGNEVITYDQVLKTQLSIAGSEDVIRKAVAAVGPGRLLATQDFAPDSDVTAAAFAVAKANSIFTVEPNTFILKIAFRHGDPAMAARFANQLASEYLARRTALYRNQGDVDFFREQEKRFNDDLHAAAAALDVFSREKRIYSISEQRRLLLQARAAAAKELDDNATQVARAESELNSLKYQLSSLRKNITLPVEIFGESNLAPRGPKRDEALSNDPPLLNVKIYQESAARLVAMNADLAGLRATASLRSNEMSRIEAQLDQLAANEATFEDLQRRVTQASGYIENLAKRAGEARINDAWRSNEAFSTAQVIQSATVPGSPNFPRPMLFMALGVTCGLIFYVIVTYLSHTAVRSGRSRSNLSFWTGWEPRAIRAWPQ